MSRFMKNYTLLAFMVFALFSNNVAFSQSDFPTGNITVKEYHGMGGTSLNELKKNGKFPSSPDFIKEIRYFEWPQSGDISKSPPGNVKDNYGWMIEGYIYPPKSGNYVFYINSDDNGELFLSTDSSPTNKKLIASEPQWNSVRNFQAASRRKVVDNSTGRRINQSVPISLKEGKPYYIQALAKEGGGGDNLAVAWKRPGMKNPEIIDGKYLSQIGHINHTGEVQYTIAQLLQKDFAQIQQDTNGGRADIYIINLIPGKKIKGPALLKGDVCVWIPEKQLDKYKKLGLSELEVCYNLEARTVEGKLRVEPKFLKGGNIGGSFVAGPMGLRDIAISGEDLGIQLGTSPAQLQTIGASVNDLHLNPGWFIHGDLGISVGRKKIAGQWPIYVATKGTWSSNGYFQLNTQYQCFGITTGAGELKYIPAEQLFSASAWMDMYYGALTGTVKLNARPNYFNGHFGMTVQIPRKIPIIGGINFGGANVDATITDKYWELGAAVWFQVIPDVPRACIPEVCVSWSIPCPRVKCSWRGCKYWTHWHRGRTCTPRICTPRIDNSWSRAKFNVRYHSKHGFTAARGGQLAKMFNDNQVREPWENPLVAIIDVPEEDAYAVFNDNWDVLYENVIESGNRAIRKQGPQIENIEVVEDIDTAIFRISYEKTIDNINLTLITPDGAELDIHAGPMPFGFKEGAKGTGTVNLDANEAFFLLKDVKKGTYRMVIENADKMGGTLVELASANAVPELYGAVASESSARDGSVIPNQFDIDWAYDDKDGDENTVISFYVDKDREGFDGHYVGGGLISELNIDEPFTFLTDSIGLRPGWYYTYVEVNDGRNMSERIYSDERIYIDMDNAPDSVEVMSTLSINKGFKVAWDKVGDSRVDYYNVVCSKSPTFDDIVSSTEIHPLPGQTKFTDITIEGLENGTPYFVSVLTVDSNYTESSPKVIHRVVPSKYPGGTPPTITSSPSDKATVGYEWHYRPIFFDGDEHNPEIVDDLTEQVRTELDWTLISAPNGMQIDKLSGLITWKPETGQEGVHKIVISAKEHKSPTGPLPDGEFTFDVHGQFATQEFEINVFPEHLLNGVPYKEDTFSFLSVPHLTAVKGTTYQYSPQVYMDEQEYVITLINGPKGVEVKDNKVKWDVPSDAQSDFIELRAESTNGDRTEQRYFLHVHSDESVLKRPTEIVKYQALNGGLLVGWTGNANKYQIQKTDNLSPGKNGLVEWENVGEPFDNAPVNFHVEKEIKSSGYFRVLEID